MYNKKFLDVVDFAYTESKVRYCDTTILNEPNPYYLRFGNPDSDVIIFGQEKAIAKDDSEKINAESIQNPFQWKKIIQDEISNKWIE